MLPDQLKNKANKRIVEAISELLPKQIIANPMMGEQNCHLCNRPALFAVLFKDSREIVPICSDDINTSLHKIRYSENLNTYNKRANKGYFKTWRTLDAVDKKNPRVGN